jgi:hypothetical protein
LDVHESPKATIVLGEMSGVEALRTVTHLVAFKLTPVLTSVKDSDEKFPQTGEAFNLDYIGMKLQ